ncbi:MAG: hypothetical protein ACJAZY_002893 [Spirosomataceae bacterium]|jgi:hypothetical protein
MLSKIYAMISESGFDCFILCFNFKENEWNY